MTKLTFRPMQRSDILPLSDWLAALPLLQRYEFTADKARAALEGALRQADMLLVCDAEDAPDLACGLAWVMPRGGLGRSAYLRLLAVNQAYAGLGIGAGLLAQAEQLAARSTQDMLLLVSDFNVDAQQFYRRLGYTQIGAIPDYVLPGVTELLFRKRLAGL
ncbi:MAG: GNAT family N-acetyltransferase [Anaerolineae bacterium]|nr:GNAT family N-acetyltransferase [Anaerolineae bacterium]